MSEPAKIGFLSDGKKPSHTRLLVMLTVPALVLVPLLTVTYLAIFKEKPFAIDPTVPLYIQTANMVVLGYAAHNKRQESKDTKPQEVKAP